MATEVFSNNPSTTVSSGGTDAPAPGTSESWTVASASGWPSASTGVTQFHIADPALPSELIAVTNTSGVTWTVTRGAETTTPVAHTAGFTIVQVVSAGAFASFVQSSGGSVLTVPAGGTGGTAATAYCVITGGTTATAPFQTVASVGGSAQVLTSNGAGQLPTWQNAASGFSNPMTTAGDMIYESAGTAATRLAIGTVNYGLVSNGTLPTWQPVALLSGAAFTGPVSVAGTLSTAKSLLGGTFALSDAGTIAVNAANGNHFTVTLGGNHLLGAPTNPSPGQKITFEIIQDATGSRTLTYASAYEFATPAQPTLGTAASVHDVLGFIYLGALSKWCFTGSAGSFS